MYKKVDETRRLPLQLAAVASPLPTARRS